MVRIDSMHNDVTYMVALCDLELRMRDLNRHAHHLSELQDLQRGPGPIRRLFTSLTGRLRPAGEIPAGAPVTSFVPEG
jgi:hypothetical protein